MKSKGFDFEDGGLLHLVVDDDGKLRLQLQALHPGDGFKVSSLSVLMDASRAKEMTEWLSNALLKEVASNELG